MRHLGVQLPGFQICVGRVRQAEVEQARFPAFNPEVLFTISPYAYHGKQIILEGDSAPLMETGNEYKTKRQANEGVQLQKAVKAYGRTGGGNGHEDCSQAFSHRGAGLTI